MSDEPLKPIGDEAQFSRVVDELVAVSAPRLFAVVAEEGGQVDAWVEAWGLAFEDGLKEIVIPDSDVRLSLHSLKIALLGFTRKGIRPRIVWAQEAQENTDSYQESYRYSARHEESFSVTMLGAGVFVVGVVV